MVEPSSTKAAALTRPLPTWMLRGASKQSEQSVLNLQNTVRFEALVTVPVHCIRHPGLAARHLLLDAPGTKYKQGLLGVLYYK